MKSIQVELRIALLFSIAILSLAYITLHTWQRAEPWETNSTSLYKYNWQKVGRTAMSKDDEVTDKRDIYPDELLEFVEALSPEFYQTLLRQSPVEKADADNFASEPVVGGRLAILLYYGRGSQAIEAPPYLDDLEGGEWVALFRDVLNCPISLDEPYLPGDNLNERHERRRLKFQQELKDYPMLGRIWDTYIDIAYEPEEISKLRDECLTVQSVATSNEVALRGLSKLINACDQAYSGNVGIELTSD